MKKIIRTPDNRFERLPDYSFDSHYLEVEEGLRMHYLDEGDKTDPIILLLHGEPSWSFLYRKMIPILTKNRFRALVPDLIGFGKSDKLVNRKDYTYQKHLDWMATFIKKLDLTEILLFCQDWGGLIGLRLLTEMGERFSMIAASNTALPTGKVSMPESFFKWREYSQNSKKFDIGQVINMGTVKPLSEEVIAAYNAPFPSEEYKAGAREFPVLVPTGISDLESDKNHKAWNILKQWQKPFFTIFGDHDDIMRGAELVFQNVIPGAHGQNHVLLNAGHFIQEEKGEELARLLIEFYRTNKRP